MEQKRFLALFLAALGLVGSIMLLFWFSGIRSAPGATPAAEPFLIEDTRTLEEDIASPPLLLSPDDGEPLPILSPSPAVSTSPVPSPT